jgi:ribulose-5-phosphate 4-epimerase/fuculose-1-phosphate aldolase
MKSEGIIKFQLHFTPAPALPAAQLDAVNYWRQVLYAHKLIGQEPQRYGGYGFGNISQRLPPFDAPEHHRRFAITGTQTGELATLGPEHYAIVTECDPDRNLIAAEGPIRPSSESLTHGTLYDLDAGLRFVLHAHSPEIWRHAAALNLPVTDANVPYGTPEMAAEVRRLFGETDVATRLVFSMGGHEDGIVAFGRTAEEAGEALLACLQQAVQL